MIEETRLFVSRIETKFGKGLRLGGGQVCEIEVEVEGNRAIDDLQEGVLYRYLRFGCRVVERTGCVMWRLNKSDLARKQVGLWCAYKEVCGRCWWAPSLTVEG